MIKKALIVVVLALTLVASAQATHSPYDIAGWVEEQVYASSTPEWTPTHRHYAGGGDIRLGINASDTKAVPFKVCMTKQGRVLKCWTSSAWPIKRITVTWSRVGNYVVKWYVRGRIRATWPLYVYGENA